MATVQTRTDNTRTPVARGFPSFDVVLPDFWRDLSCADAQDNLVSSECALKWTPEPRQFLSQFKLHSISTAVGRRCPGFDFASDSNLH